MIDMHCHFMFGVDDGAKNIEESIEILKSAKENGVTGVFATPHFIENDKYSKTKATIDSNINDIKNKLFEENINIEIYPGNEIYITPNIIELIKENKISFLNNSKYILVELPLNEPVNYLDDFIFNILSLDKIPIIAHPERYAFVKNNPDLLYKLSENGVLFQLNTGSLLGQYGNTAKKTAKYLLKRNLYSFIGSDSHSSKLAYKKHNKALKHIKTLVNKEEYKKLTTENPLKVIENQDIISKPIHKKKFLFDF